MAGDSQILFLSERQDLYSPCVLECMRTQTRPRFYVPSERRGITLLSNTQYPHRHCPGSNLGPINICDRLMSAIHKYILSSLRFALVAEDGVVKGINVEPDGTGLTCSKSGDVMKLL